MRRIAIGAVFCFIAAVALGLTPTAAEQTTAGPAEQEGAFTCTPTHVWDGDGPIWCAEGPRIRLSGIAARELRIQAGRAIDGGCNEGHPCPAMPGPTARNVLVGLLGRPTGTGPHGHVLVKGPPLACVAVGATYNRTAARCALPDGRELSCAMIAVGAAVRWERHDRDGRLVGC